MLHQKTSLQAVAAPVQTSPVCPLTNCLSRPLEAEEKAVGYYTQTIVVDMTKSFAQICLGAKTPGWGKERTASKIFKERSRQSEARLKSPILMHHQLKPLKELWRMLWHLNPQCSRSPWSSGLEVPGCLCPYWIPLHRNMDKNDHSWCYRSSSGW